MEWLLQQKAYWPGKMPLMPLAIFSILFTSCTVTPEPMAMRRLRLALIKAGLARSLAVIELMMAYTWPMARSAVPSGTCFDISPI